MDDTIARILLSDGRVIISTEKEITFIHEQIYLQPAYPIRLIDKILQEYCITCGDPCEGNMVEQCSKCWAKQDPEKIEYYETNGICPNCGRKSYVNDLDLGWHCPMCGILKIGT